MGEKPTEYRLLNDSQAFQSSIADNEYSLAGDGIISSSQCPQKHCRKHQLGVLVLIMSIVLNVATYTQLRLQQSRTVDPRLSKYAGLEANIKIPYQYKTDFSGDNETLANELWESINSTSAGAIALDHQWAASKGLTRAQDFPWDKDKGIYYVQGIHDVHCVKLLRKSIHEYHHKYDQSVNYQHLHHCLDAFRLRFMCIADDTPLATHPGRDHQTGQGQIQQCRDWDKLVSWADDSVRHACYGQVNEYTDATHSLERFQFCHDGSPFRSSMEAYFAKHGHRELD